MGIFLDIFSQLAEEKIRKAYQEGFFKDLPGFGKPLDLDDLQGIPEDMRMAVRI